MTINVHNSCDGKIKYENKIAIEYHLQSNHLEGVEDYYKCPYCDGFHAFTIPGKKKLSNKINKRNFKIRNSNGPRKMKNKRSQNGKKGKGN